MDISHTTSKIGYAGSVVYSLTFPVPQRPTETGKILLFQSLRNGVSVGHYNVPGLPDAQGYIRPIADQGKTEEPITNASGAFGVQSYVEGGGGFMSGGTCRATRISMSLANSNVVYGASSTVMPASADILVGLYLGRLT